MKLKKEYITQTVGDTQVMVPVGKEAQNFHGIVRSNGTAAFIIECFRKDITQEAAVDALCDHYEVDRETAVKAVADVVEKLKSIGAFEA